MQAKAVSIVVRATSALTRAYPPSWVPGILTKAKRTSLRGLQIGAERIPDSPETRRCFSVTSGYGSSKIGDHRLSKTRIDEDLKMAGDQDQLRSTSAGCSLQRFLPVRLGNDARRAARADAKMSEVDSARDSPSIRRLSSPVIPIDAATIIPSKATRHGAIGSKYQRPDDRTEPEGWRFHRSWWAIVTTRPGSSEVDCARPSMLAFTVASDACRCVLPSQAHFGRPSRDPVTSTSQVKSSQSVTPHPELLHEKRGRRARDDDFVAFFDSDLESYGIGPDQPPLCD